MKLTLKRNQYRSDGIYGELLDDRGSHLWVTLEHAYQVSDTPRLFQPKVLGGSYDCVRGEHRLASMENPFITFEITGVEGHTDILFHMGNYNEDSHGCVLLGRQIGNRMNGGKMITDSKRSFEAFMTMLDGLDSFTLEVE
jgi:hypothetical protein